MRNSELLRLAVEGGFEVFLTADQNLEYQQNLQRLGAAVVVVVSRTSRMEDLRPLIPGILQAIPAIRRGEVVRVDK
jgi:hypothetical protein